ncbi:EFNB [Lepeophtheirus salmonis]|uniref:EFNB n=1 Tax=Lepeophtheirus salmonis TaxID=72036 RepID=A0A7R8CI27_LEPSM|nr:EFNB [Lepeophtheirus salmonis]CAF2827974.1 EFNB [Lepeophtheirus salmonis]
MLDHVDENINFAIVYSFWGHDTILCSIEEFLFQRTYFRMKDTFKMISKPFEIKIMGHLPHKHPHRTSLSSTLFILIFIILPSEIHFEEYESCRIRNPNPRIIALCNSPYKAHYYTITFRSFTPTPGGLEFNPGQSYYFISTSSRNDLHRRVSGRCLSNNMKLTFKLAPLPSSAEDALKVPSINVPRITSSPSPSTKTDYNYYYEYPLNDIKK